MNVSRHKYPPDEGFEIWVFPQIDNLNYELDSFVTGAQLLLRLLDLLNASTRMMSCPARTSAFIYFRRGRAQMAPWPVIG